MKAGQLLKYNAKAIDPDADPVSYSLVLAPKGMTVDAETGTVIWNPTKRDIDEYYAQLEADRQRLGAVRATAIAKTPIFNVLVRAQDGKGGQALQYIGLWTKLNLKKDKFLAKGDNESLKQKTNHHPPHHYGNNCHRDRISKIPRQVAQPIQEIGRQRHGVVGCTV